MVPADSRRISRVPRYSGNASPRFWLSDTGLSPSPAGLSRAVPLAVSLGFVGAPTTPAAPRRRRFGLLRFRSPLLAESLLFSSPAGTEMFQFPAFAQHCAVTALRRSGSPIRTPPDQCAFAAPRRFSQLVTSFFATESLGILRAPFSPFLFVHAPLLSRRVRLGLARRGERGLFHAFRYFGRPSLSYGPAAICRAASALL